MSKINTGGPAFPSHGSMGEVTQEGMTLRDYFAAGALANTYTQDDASRPDKVAKWAYEVADAMLKERQVK